MTGLRDLFEEAADSAAPPSRLTAAEVYDAGRRRHRWRLRATSAGATALAVAAVAIVNLLSPAPLTGDQPPVAGRATTTVETDPIPAGRIAWAGAADRDHLYLALSSCPSVPCRKESVLVVGSTDGGRTWQRRSETILASPQVVVGPDVLLAVTTSGPGGTTQNLLASRDGGRTWVSAKSVGTVETVPAGGAAICWPPQSAKPCVLHAVDPATGAVGQLAAQPPLTVQPDELRIKEAAGRLWVPGTDPATGRPAVATSADAGRSWSTHVFTDAPPCGKPQCVPPLLAVTGTAATYTVTSAHGASTVYRSDDTGSRWQRLAAAGAPGAPASTFVTADGAHVLTQLVNSHGADVRRYWAYRGGNTYQQVELDGLPASAGPVRRTPDGWFYAPDPGGTLYGSTDGWRWAPVTHR